MDWTGCVSGPPFVHCFVPKGPEVYLNYCKVLIKHFKGLAQGLSDRVKKLAYDRFQQAGIKS
jgi:hypothetical protein